MPIRGHPAAFLPLLSSTLNPPSSSSSSSSFSSHLSGIGSADAFQANVIAREMVLSMGMGRRTGPLDLMHTTSASQVTPGLRDLASGLNPRQPLKTLFYPGWHHF